jgi:tRNA (guanine37-N1)-methyltransferase
MAEFSSPNFCGLKDQVFSSELEKQKSKIKNPLRIDILTLFPEILRIPLGESILGRAQRQGLAEIHLHQLRDYTIDKHRTVDDRPYGGGPGMLLRCEPIFAAVTAIQAMAPAPGRVILLSPSGRLFRQAVAQELQQQERFILICGHYEGVDQRVLDHLIDEELSIGDYVLSNGAVAALVVVDAVVRLIPGALGNEESAGQDSFTEALLEGPQYTRPPEFNTWPVPPILLSGNHAEIAQWRRQEAEQKTTRVRPDLNAKTDR